MRDTSKNMSTLLGVPIDNFQNNKFYNIQKNSRPEKHISNDEGVIFTRFKQLMQY